ncbi:TetR/AcrR family transcriptional regulator [Demequina lutea]|uniref:AcrR family transcriptional regulator n=1 Tax=Demequina lutea TaxID=431489 RepID=A0A7Z0CHN0_9MICO|nr:TetR family transcriptional regulator [Demequina lutea]NYI40994.1 AcrR family transcriptional regulator [Demequina lutea]
MHITPAVAAPDSDLTARARIREAAIACFASQGFGASFTTIAKSAGVSPGLITHHFGSKAALRSECDAEVLRRYQAIKTDGVANPSGSLLHYVADPSIAAPLLVYILRAVHAGGRAAREFLEHLVDEAREAMRASVEAGLVRPSRDDEARLRYLIFQSIGALLVELLTMPDATPDEFVAAALASQRDQMLPMLEIFTEGMLTTRQMLDDYLDYVGDPPREDVPADAVTA